MEELTEYEIKIKRAFNEACEIHNSNSIVDHENWEFLMMSLQRLKLLSIKD